MALSELPNLKFSPYEKQVLTARLNGKSISELSENERNATLSYIIVQATAIFGYAYTTSDEELGSIISVLSDFLKRSGFDAFTEEELMAAIYLQLCPKDGMPIGIEFDDLQINPRRFNVFDYSKILRNYSGLRNLLERKIARAYEEQKWK